MSRPNIIVPGQQQGPKPVGIRIAMFDHGQDFKQVQIDIEAWFAQPAIRQLTNINTIAVTEKNVTTWYTVIYYVLFM